MLGSEGLGEGVGLRHSIKTIDVASLPSSPLRAAPRLDGSDVEQINRTIAVAMEAEIKLLLPSRAAVEPRFQGAAERTTDHSMLLFRSAASPLRLRKPNSFSRSSPSGASS